MFFVLEKQKNLRQGLLLNKLLMVAGMVRSASISTLPLFTGMPVNMLVLMHLHAAHLAFFFIMHECAAQSLGPALAQLHVGFCQSFLDLLGGRLEQSIRNHNAGAFGRYGGDS